MFNCVCVRMGRWQTERAVEEKTQRMQEATDAAPKDEFIYFAVFFFFIFFFFLFFLYSVAFNRINSAARLAIVSIRVFFFSFCFFFVVVFGSLRILSFHFHCRRFAIIFFDTSFLSSSPFRLISEYGLFILLGARMSA